MNIKLRRVESKDDINLFVQYKISLVKFHQQYANAIGLIDKVVENYDENDAKKHIGEDKFYQFIIEYNGKDVGIIEYDIETSNIDNLKILFIKKLFIDSKYRKIGIGKTVLQKIKSETNLRVELECWYGMPANDLYKSLGMKELKTRYIF